MSRNIYFDHYAYNTAENYFAWRGCWVRESRDLREVERRSVNLSGTRFPPMRSRFLWGGFFWCLIAELILDISRVLNIHHYIEEREANDDESSVRRLNSREPYGWSRARQHNNFFFRAFNALQPFVLQAMFQHEIEADRTGRSTKSLRRNPDNLTHARCSRVCEQYCSVWHTY